MHGDRIVSDDALDTEEHETPAEEAAIPPHLDGFIDLVVEAMLREIQQAGSDPDESVDQQPEQPRRLPRYLRQSSRDRQKAKRLALEKKARRIGRHTGAQWAALVKFCGYKCVRCRMPERIERDHIVPLSEGGCDCIGNLQPLCWRCNSSKGPECVDFRPVGWSAALMA